jgi:gephyrin
MISVSEALEKILSNTDILETEDVFYLDAMNRVCAKRVIANEPLPPFRASVKDGFAVKLTAEQRKFIDINNQNSEDENLRFIFDVIGSSNAGDEMLNIDLKEGQCVKINTGAPVPLKADLVVQIEDTISLEKNEKGVDQKIEIVSASGCGGGKKTSVSLKLDQDIRPIGFDIKIGEEVVAERMIIKPPQIGICATVGALEINVFKTPRVGLISTGNELVRPEDRSVNVGKIRDSNKALLHAALKSNGIQNVYDAGIASDDPNSVLKIFKNALEYSDVIISTGGVSMGDKDLVKDVLEKDLNCKIHFARMNMKPGKPTTFATCFYEGKKKLFFCLPGNH